MVPSIGRIQAGATLIAEAVSSGDKKKLYDAYQAYVGILDSEKSRAVNAMMELVKPKDGLFRGRPQKRQRRR